MPCFSLRRLLISITIVAVGLMAVSMMFSKPPQRLEESTRFILWYLGGALIGAGVFAPFKKVWIGLLVGLIAQFLIWSALVLYALTVE
jgi:hypothetical protein